MCLCRNKYCPDVAKEMLGHVNKNDTLIKRIITGDKACIFETDMLTKHQ